MSIKRTLYAVLVLILIVAMFSGCNSSGTSSGSVDISALMETMTTADEDLPQMATVSSKDEDGEDLFEYLSDLDYSEVQDYFFAYSDSGRAEEIAVIVLKDESKAEEAVDSLKAHVDERVTLFTTYSPEQVEQAKNAYVFSKDNMAVMIMGENADVTKTAFEKYVEENLG